MCLCLSTTFSQTADNQNLKELEAKVDQLFDEGKYAEAIPVVQACIKATADVDSLCVTHLMNLAVLQMQLEKYKDAEASFLKAKAKAIAAYGPESESLALVYSNLGNLYLYAGRFEEAEKTQLLTLEIKAKTMGKDNPSYANSLNNLAGLFINLGRYDDAVPFFTEAKDIYQKLLGADHPDYAIALSNLSYTYQKLGQFAEAEPLQLEAKRINLNALGAEHPQYARNLNNLAALYKATDRYEEAVKAQLEASQIWGKVLGTNHQDYATSRNNLAQLYLKIKEYDAAEALIKEAQKIRLKVLGKEHPTYANTLINLSELYLEKGNTKAAAENLLEAKAILALIADGHHPDYITVLDNLAQFYLKNNQLDSAAFYNNACIQQNSLSADLTNKIAFEQATYYYNSHITDALQTLLQITEKEYELNKDKKALERYYQIAKSALQLNERIKNDFSADQNKLMVLKNNGKFVAAGIDAAIKMQDIAYIKEAFGFSELNKSVLLADANKAQRAKSFSDLPENLALQEMEMQASLDKLKKQQIEAIDEDQKATIIKELNAINLEIDDLKRTTPNITN